MTRRRISPVFGVLLAISAACRVTESQSEKPASAAEPIHITPDGEKTADRILAETNELQVTDKWYGNVYPALRMKYGRPVPRALYDAWRKNYFRDSVMPIALKYGYSPSVFEEAFDKATERQPSD
jgi:hypothetical protein